MLIRGKAATGAAIHWWNVLATLANSSSTGTMRIKFDNTITTLVSLQKKKKKKISFLLNQFIFRVYFKFFKKKKNLN